MPRQLRVATCFASVFALCGGMPTSVHAADEKPAPLPRIVVTVGEKIGKTHLSYGQGASAELVAMTTIGAADLFGLPVSTTHVLSSGIAGSMVASKGVKNLQPETVRNILLAWFLTLPVVMTLAGSLFLLFRGIF